MKKKDKNIVLIQGKVEKLFSILQINPEFEIAPVEDDFYSIKISGENLGPIIGFRGKNISSIETLLRMMFTEDEYGIKLHIDINNFREERNKYIESKTKNAIEYVRKTGKKYTMFPMTPFERSIVHRIVKEDEGLTSSSIGEDPNRQVIIYPGNYKER